MAELTLDTFQSEVKGLFESMTSKLKGHEGDLDKVRAEMEAFKAEQKAAIDAVNTKINRPAQPETKDEKVAAYSKAFKSYLTTGNDSEVKALATGTLTEGGFLLPHNLAQDIVKNSVFYAPIRGLARVQPISSGDSFEQPTLDTEHTVGRVAEKAARTETTSGTIGMQRIPVHEFYANAYATQRMLDDTNFNVESLISERVNLAFQSTVASDYVNGTGVNGPKGFTTETVQNVLSGTAGALTIAGMVKLYTKVKPVYRINGTFAMNSATLGTLYGLASTTGAPLLQPQLSGSMGMEFMGKPIVEFPELADIGAAAFPVYFGDWSKAYMIVDRTDYQTLRDPYSAKPYVQFYTTWRTGGQLILAEAIAKLKSNDA